MCPRKSVVSIGILCVLFLGLWVGFPAMSEPPVSDEGGGRPTGVTMNEALPDLTKLVDAKSSRASSWDQTGANRDCIPIGPGETAVLADIKGSGMITSFYVTAIEPDLLDYRDTVLRMYWDGETTPSVEVPLGDFFCISNCTVRRFSSLMMAINLGSGDAEVNNGLNCYFPMPFSEGARIEVTNESEGYFGGQFGGLWYHINYEQYTNPLPENVGRFHAQWRRENPTQPAGAPKQPWDDQAPFKPNLDGKENFVMLEAEGRGHIAGLFLQVNNIVGGWWGEGDDMVFVDGDVWPPSMHGTGTEEVFGGGAGPNKEYASLYTGFLLVENKGGIPTYGKSAMYRWYVPDPIRFTKSVRMSIEHGHANDSANDYIAGVYWYQNEPHAAFPKFPSRVQRLPDVPEEFLKPYAKLKRLSTWMVPAFRDNVFDGKTLPPGGREIMRSMRQARRLLGSKDYGQADTILDQALDLMSKAQSGALPTPHP